MIKILNSQKENKSIVIGFVPFSGKPVSIDLDTIDRHLLYTGKSGSGKSYASRFHFMSLAQHRSVGLIDPNSHLANDMLDEISLVPSLRKRCLYLTITSKTVAPLIDFMQQADVRTASSRARRIYLASFFTTSLIMTAGTGGTTAGAGFTRLKMNVEMGVRLLLELGLPMALLQSLFQYQSKVLETLIGQCLDVEVTDHFRNLQSIGNANQFYTLVESTITRLNLFFNSAVSEAIFSAAGSGLSIDDLMSRKKLILIGDFGVTDESTADHSRLLQKILLESLTRSAMKRTEEEAKANPLSLYIDEASSSGLLDLANTEALQSTRKFGLHTAYIVQGTAGVENRQPDIRLMDAVLENTSGKFIFGTASDVDAQRFARLAIGGMDFKDVKHKKESERLRIIGYEERNRMTITTNPDGKQSTSVSPFERPITKDEIDESLTFYTPEELFNLKAGELLSLPIGHFYYFGPEYPRGILLTTPPPPVFTKVTARMRKRKREEFIAAQLSQFPYRDMDGVRRSLEELIARYQLPQMNDPNSDSENGNLFK